MFSKPLLLLLLLTHQHSPAPLLLTRPAAAGNFPLEVLDGPDRGALEGHAEDVENQVHLGMQLLQVQPHLHRIQRIFRLSRGVPGRALS